MENSNSKRMQQTGNSGWSTVSGYPRSSVPNGGGNKQQPGNNSSSVSGNSFDCYKTTTASPISGHMKGGYERNQLRQSIPPPPGFHGRPYSEAPLRLGPPPQASQHHVWQATPMSDGRVLNTLMFPNVPVIPQPMFLDPYSASSQHNYYQHAPMIGPLFYEPYNNSKSLNPLQPPPPPPSPESNYSQTTPASSDGSRTQNRNQSLLSSKKNEDSKNKKSKIAKHDKRISEMRPNAQSFFPNESVNATSDEIKKASSKSTMHEQLKKLTEANSANTENKAATVELVEEYEIKLSLEEGRSIWEKPVTLTSRQLKSPCKFKDDTDDIDDLLYITCGPHVSLMEEQEEGESKEKVEEARTKLNEDEARTNENAKQEDSPKTKTDEAEDDAERKSPVVIPRKPIVSATRDMVTTTGNYEFTEMARYRGMVYQKNPSAENATSAGRDRQSNGGTNTSRNYTSTGGSWQPAPPSHHKD